MINASTNPNRKPNGSAAIHCRFVSFGSERFSQARERLTASYQKFGITDFKSYTTDDPVIERFVEDYPKIARQKRGWGYWLWKAIILEHELRNVPDGTAVFYTDIATELISDPSPLVELAAKTPIVLFQAHHKLLQRIWTKRDCFVLMDTDRQEYWDMIQLAAGFQLYRAGPEARSFVAQYKQAMLDERILTDQPNVMGKENFPDFKDHRHDQSVLTMLSKQHGLEVFRDPSQNGNNYLKPKYRPDPQSLPKPNPVGIMENSDYGQIFNQHRKRDSLVRLIIDRLRRSSG